MMQFINKSIRFTLIAQKGSVLPSNIGVHPFKRLLLTQRCQLEIAQRSHSTQQQQSNVTNSNLQHDQTQHTNDTKQEVNHHDQLAGEWWNPNGQMRALHALNEIRVPFIRDGLISRGAIDPKLLNTSHVLQGQNILEVGCGGGILSEQLARLDANVTAIDLAENLIQAARDHATTRSPRLVNRLTYKIEPIELHVKDHLECYDAVVVSEVLEHITDKPAFLTACVQTLKPGGSIFITTLNKTLPMWLGGVLLGEYVLNLAPKGTHHWDKMISPLDVQRILDALNCQTVLINGSTYDFWRNTWRWINSTSFCYALQAVKSDLN